MRNQDHTGRRSAGAHGEGGTRADEYMAGAVASAPMGQMATQGSLPTQGSVEPFRRPDYKAKKHSRPAKWADRRDRRERQEREWVA